MHMPKIAIIGGGIGGLAAAVTLRMRGMEVTVHERSPELREIGAGLRLTPNALKALRVLGLENEAMEIGVRIDRSTTRSWHSAAVISTQDTGAARYGASALAIHRADMLELFNRRLPDGVVRLNAICAEVQASTDTAMARFADGSQIEADVIVGADGIHSVVRASLFGADQPRFTGCVCWRGLIPIERFPHEAHGTTRWLGPHGHVVSYPVRRGELLNFVAHYDSDAWTEESWTREADRAELLKTYSGWNDAVLRMLDSGERYYKWALYDRAPLPGWGRDRATLLGDAAHSMLPYLSQGASMTLEDACVLAQELARTPRDLSGALRRYEGARMPRTSRAQLGSRARAKENHLASPIARLRRDLLTKMRARFSADKTPDGVSWIYDFDVGRAEAS
ncbi:MAG: FAD-binding protein [Betaproteobacteria bacterium]|nr:FAD-binding protein [Betaproteobacteria bacterium]